MRPSFRGRAAPDSVVYPDLSPGHAEARAGQFREHPRPPTLLVYTLPSASPGAVLSLAPLEGCARLTRRAPPRGAGSAPGSARTSATAGSSGGRGASRPAEARSRADHYRPTEALLATAQT